MSDLCIVCKKIVKERQEALMCEGGCESWQHRVCGIPIDRAFYRRLVKGEIEYQWTCNSCQIIDITPASPPLLPDDMLNFSSPAAESTHLDLLQIPVSSLEQTTGYDQPEPMDDYTVVESSSFQSHTNNILDTINDNSSFNVDNSYTVPLPIDESSIQELNDDSDFPMEEVSVRYTIITRGRKPGPSPKPARAGPGFGPEYVGPGRASGLSTSGRASGRKVLIASGLFGPGLPCAFEFRLVYIIKTQLLCVCLCVCLSGLY